MRVGKAPPAKIRHRIALAPDNIIQNPVIRGPATTGQSGKYCDSCRSPKSPRPASAPGDILSASPQPGDHRQQNCHNCPRHHPPHRPASCPAGAMPLQLQIIGRVGKHQINTGIWQAGQPVQTIPRQNLILQILNPALSHGCSAHLSKSRESPP